MAEEFKESSPLATLLSDPKLVSTLAGVLGSTDGKAPSNTEQPSNEAPSLSEGLGSVLSNPDLMAKLPAVIAMLRPMLESNAEAPPKEASEDLTQERAITTGTGVTPPPVKPSQERCRKDLLLALKPFLSKERCEAVDMILRLSTLGALLKQLG